MRGAFLWVSLVFAPAFLQACTVGRDLTYVDPGQGSSATTASIDDAGNSGSQGQLTDPDAGSSEAVTPPPDAGVSHEAGPPPSATCPAGSQGEVEPNTDSSEATPVDLGTICGDLVVGTDEDWYKFTVGPSGTVDLRLDDPVGDALLAWAGVGGNVHGSLSAGGETRFPATAGMEIYLEILSTMNRPQSYVITIK